MQLDLTVHPNCGGKGSYNLHLIKKDFPLISFFSLSLRSGESGRRPPAWHATPWGLRKRRKRQSWRWGEETGNLNCGWKEKLVWGWRGGTLECKTGWFICEVATEQRLDSSSLHIESNSIYQCAWTQPLWQYQPLSVPVSLEKHNHRYMPLY